MTLVKTPGDRPILGTVAAHWDADEPHEPPKLWGGNGIPNTTTKYKEVKCGQLTQSYLYLLAS